MVKVGVYPSKLKKQPFSLIISTSRGEPPLSPPSDAHECDVCIPNHVVTRSVSKKRDSPHWKNFLPP